METLTNTAEIENTIVQNNSGGMMGDEIETQFPYRDDVSREKYYMASIEAKHVVFPEYILESDEMFQGNKMVLFYSHKDLQKDDLLDIRLYGCSKGSLSILVK